MNDPQQRRPDPTVETVCPRCSVGCRLRYDDRTGRATGIEGAPVNREGRLCAKGIAAFEGLDDENRLTRPLIREAGSLVPVPWERAYDRIEAELSRVLDEHGPDALAFLGAPRCTNEENYLFEKLARVLGTNTVDNRARACHEAAESVMAERLGSSGTTNSLADLADADAYLVVGANPATQQPIAFDSFVRPAVNDGATLIHVDPRATRTTRLADHHLALRPGCDAAVVGLLAATVLEDGLTDRAFVAERTTGFGSYAETLCSVDIETCARGAGLSPDRVRAAGRAFGRADRAAVLVGTGIETDERRGRAAADALVNVLLLTGNLGRRGTGMNPLRGLVNEQGANDAGCRPATLPGYESVTNPVTRARVAGEWGVEPPATPGLTEHDAVLEFGDSIRGAFVLGENPAVSKLDHGVVERGLDALEFLLVQDVFPTATTAHADVVLPASAWAEKAGTVTNLDRQVQRLRPTAPPPGDARSDRHTLQELGARLTDGAFEYDGPAAVFAELARVNPLYAGLSYEGIGHESQRWPYPTDASVGTRVLHRDRFANGAKRTPFVPVAIDAPVEEAPPSAEDGLVLLTRTRLNESDGGHSGADESEPSASVGERETVWLHPADAHSRDIDDGDRVTMDVDGRTATATATLTRDVRRHTAFLDADAADRLADEGRTRVRVTARRP